MRNIQFALVCFLACLAAGLSSYFGQNLALDHTIVNQTMINQNLAAANQQCAAAVQNYENMINDFNEKQAAAMAAQNPSPTQSPTE